MTDIMPVGTMPVTMTTPVDTAPASKADLDGYRQEIAETAWAIGVHSELIRDYAALGDDVGLRYQIKCLFACARAVGGTFADLIQHKIEIAGSST